MSYDPHSVEQHQATCEHGRIALIRNTKPYVVYHDTGAVRRYTIYQHAVDAANKAELPEQEP